MITNTDKLNALRRIRSYFNDQHLIKTKDVEGVICIYWDTKYNDLQMKENLKQQLILLREIQNGQI